MDRASNWSTAGLADELGIIRFTLELSIEWMQLYGRYPSPHEIQKELHKHDRDRPDPPPAA